MSIPNPDPVRALSESIYETHIEPLRKELDSVKEQRDRLDAIGARAFLIFQEAGMNAIQIIAAATDNEQSSLEIGIRILMGERDKYRNALERISKLRWGNDSDCGALAIIYEVL